MAIPEHVARLRAAVGHELLLLPAVSVLPTDQAGRLLLVRHAGHDDGWAVLGGCVEVSESPADHDEVSHADWFTRGQLPTTPLTRLSRALLRATGHLTE